MSHTRSWRLGAAWLMVDPTAWPPPRERPTRSAENSQPNPARLAELLTGPPYGLSPSDSRRAAGELLPSLRFSATDLCASRLALLDALADAVLTVERGQVVIRPDADLSELSLIVDPALLLVWLGSRLGVDPGRFAPGLAQGPFFRLLRQPMADLHSHLGGGANTPALWAMALEWPPEDATLRPLLARAEDILRRWQQQCGPLPSLSQSPRPEAWLLDWMEQERCLFYQQARAWHRGHRDGEDLFRYIQLRNAAHRRWLHQPGPRGLGTFRGVRDRRPKAQRDEPTRLALDAAATVDAALADASGHLRRSAGPAQLRHMPALDLELRMRLPLGEGSLSQITGALQGVRHALHRWEGAPARVGLVMVVSKRDEGPTLPDQRRLRRDSLERLRSLLALLADTPRLRPLVVGVDCAGDELAAEPRLIAPIFAWLRHRVDCTGVIEELPLHLGRSFHVGEDIVDIGTSMRHVHEVLTLAHLRPGDRIGHAAAAFICPKDWDRDRPNETLPLGTLALDAFWAWRLLRLREPSLAFQARERLWRAVGAAAPSAGELEALDHELLEQLPAVNRAVEQDPELAFLPAQVLGRLHVVDPQRPVAPWDPRGWAHVLAAAQDLVITELRERSVVVELSPTSNMRVIDLNDPARLPLLRLRPREPLARLREGVKVCLNTDDAGIFQTTLRREFLIVAEGLRRQGWSTAEAEQWLEDLRLEGLSAVFLSEAVPRGEGFLDRLHQLLD